MENNKYIGGGVPFDEAWLRITNSTDIKSLTDLGKILGKRQQTISASKQKNLFPYGWAYPVADKYNLLTEWILTGKGPKRLADLQGSQTYNFPVLKNLDQWLNDLVVNEPGRKEWFKVSVEDAFPMFKEWRKRREEQESKNSDSPDKKIA